MEAFTLDMHLALRVRFQRRLESPAPPPDLSFPRKREPPHLSVKSGTPNPFLLTCHPITIGSRESGNLINHICWVVMAGLTRHQIYPYFYYIILTTITHGIHRLLPGTRNN